jgi:hypothetical protein
MKMFFKKWFKLSLKPVHVVVFCFGFMVQTAERVNSAENPVNSARAYYKENIKNLEEMCHKYYEEEENRPRAILINKDFTVDYKDKSDFSLFESNTLITFGLFKQIREYATQSNNSFAVALYCHDEDDESANNVLFFCDQLYEGMKNKFAALNLPLLEEYEFKREYIREYNLKNIETGQVVCSIDEDSKREFFVTKDLQDCVGIVMRGVNSDGQKTICMAHYYYEFDVPDHLKLFRECFDTKKNVDIYLISSQYTLHLLEIIEWLQNSNCTIKGIKVTQHGSFSHHVAEKKRHFSMQTLSNLTKKDVPLSTLVILGDERVFYSEGDILSHAT